MGDPLWQAPHICPRCSCPCHASPGVRCVLTDVFAGRCRRFFACLPCFNAHLPKLINRSRLIKHLAPASRTLLHTHTQYTYYTTYCVALVLRNTLLLKPYCSPSKPPLSYCISNLIQPPPLQFNPHPAGHWEWRARTVPTRAPLEDCETGETAASPWASHPAIAAAIGIPSSLLSISSLSRPLVPINAVSG